MNSTPRAFLAVILVIIHTACGKSDSSNEEGSTAGAKYSRSASSGPNLAQSFNANTPKSMKSSSFLGLLQLTDSCSSQYTNGSAEYTACSMIAEIKSRFFGSGPVVIKDRLSDLDGRINGTLARYSTAYVPCLDEKRTTTQDFNIGVENGTKTVTYGPYSLVSLPLKATFNDGTSFDTAKTLKLSCTEEIGTGSGKIKLAYGNSDGTWYLYQEQANGIGLYGSADKDDNIELWFSIGDPTRDSAQAAKEVNGASLSTLYPQSTGIAHIISNPKAGIIGISQVGAGIGPGCGTQLLMNDSTLYFSGNVNEYGACTANDFAASASNGYKAAKDSVSICVNVNDTTLSPTTDGVETCIKSGLLSRGEDGSIVSPFDGAGLKYLTANLASTASGALKVRAWAGSIFMQGTDLSSIQKLGGVEIASKDSVEVTGYYRNAWNLLRTTSTSDDKTFVKAACNAAENSRQATLNESFELSLASIFASIPEDQTHPQSAEERKASFLEHTNKGFALTGEYAPTLDLAFYGIKGTTFRGNFSGTITVTVDNTEIGTAKVTLPDSSSALMTSKASATLKAQTMTMDSVFRVKAVGTLTLSCDNSISTTRTVSVKPGLGHISWYVPAQ